MKFVVGCDVEEFKEYYKRNGCAGELGTGELSITEEKIVTQDPSHLIVWRENKIIGHAIWHETNTEEHRKGEPRDKEDREILERFLGGKKDFVELHEVWLMKEYRGRGYGKKFFDFFEWFIGRRCFTSIVYYAFHPAAIAICRKRGYKEDYLTGDAEFVFYLSCVPEDRAENRFAEIWRERNRIQPEIMNDWVDNDWAKGRNQFLTFLVRIKDERLIGKITEVQDKLSTIPCVDRFPKDYLHITVKGCGFLAKSEMYKDDILIEDLQKIVTQTKEILQAFNKFNVLLPKLNIFSEVVLIEVHDEGKIGDLNKGLQAIPEMKKMRFDFPNLVPHISIAQFQNNQEFTKLIRYLEELRETEFGELTVNYIELVNAHLSGRYPTLETIHAFKLR